MARAILVLALAGCAITRETVITNRQIEVTEEEAAAIDAVSREASGDAYEECTVWRRFFAKPGKSPALVDYATEARDKNCNNDFVKRIDEIQRAVAVANHAPSERADQRAAVARVLEAFETNPALEKFDRALEFGAYRSETVGLIKEWIRPVTERLRDGCDDRRVIAATWAVLGQHGRAIELFGESLACIGTTEVVYLLDWGNKTHKCEPAIAVAAATWERARTRAEQIAILDGVNACSDAYTRRRNFSFVPVEVLLDYESLLLDRGLRKVRGELNHARNRLVGQCRASCSEAYAALCTSKCPGRTDCVDEDCQARMRDCIRSCGD